MGLILINFPCYLCRFPNSNFFSSTPVYDPAPELQYTEDGGPPGQEAGQEEDEGGDGDGGGDSSSRIVTFPKSKRG